MREMAGAAQDPFPVSSDGFHIQRSELNGNTAMSARQHGRCGPLSRKMSDISEEAVREQLRYILDSPEFKNKPMICGFLSHVVEETLAGRAGEIKGYTIATQVFGRKEDFDPTIDPIVRIQAGRLRRILQSYYAGRGGQDRLRIEMSKGSYIPSFSKIIPEKLQTPHWPAPGTAPAKSELSPAPSEFSRFASADFPSIALFPLVNLTNDSNIEHVARGLTEELMTGLARCHGLQISVSHPAMYRREEPCGARQAGREPVARFLLVGSIRKEEDTIKFTLRLIDANTLAQIWAEQYKYSFEPEKVIHLQEDIARKVTGKIGGFFGAIARKLSKESRSGPSPYCETYEVFTRFSQYLIDLSQQTYAKAMEVLEHARSSDPASAVSLSFQAFLHANEYALMRPENTEVLEKALALARQGVSAEPENQIARALLSYVLFVSGQRELFFREAEQTLLLNPTLPDVVALLGWSIALYGEWDRGLALLEEAMDLNPYRPGWLHLAPYLNYFRQGKFEEAYHEAEKFNPPHLFWAPLVRIAALGRLGKANEAGNGVEALLAMRPDFPVRGRKITRFFLKDPDLACTFFEGLRKAGLKTL